MRFRGWASLAFLPLAACNAAASDNAVQKFSLDEIKRHAQPVIAASPDVTNAAWVVADNANSLRFGRPDEAPGLVNPDSDVIV